MTVGTILIAVGVSAFFDLHIWPMVLIGLGAGMVLSGALGKFGFEHLRPDWGRRRGSNQARETNRDAPSPSHEPS